MTATTRARTVLARTDGPLPWHALIPKALLREVLELADDGEHWRTHHRCEESGECAACDPSPCTHHVIADDVWPAFCQQCQDIADDLAEADRCDDKRKERAL